MEKLFCQSCGMPMEKDADFGTEEGGAKSLEYCVYCMSDGKFTVDCTMDEMIENDLQFLDEFNKGCGTALTKEQARAQMQSFFPMLKRWKKAE